MGHKQVAPSDALIARF